MSTGANKQKHIPKRWTKKNGSIKLLQFSYHHRNTQSSLKPYYKQLTDQDQQLKEHLSKITAAKASILENERRMDQLLVSVIHSGGK